QSIIEQCQVDTDIGLVYRFPFEIIQLDGGGANGSHVYIAGNDGFEYTEVIERAGRGIPRAPPAGTQLTHVHEVPVFHGFLIAEMPGYAKREEAFPSVLSRLARVGLPSVGSIDDVLILKCIIQTRDDTDIAGQSIS